MGSVARSFKRANQIFRKDKVKHNGRGKRVGPAQVSSLSVQCSAPIHTHVTKSWVDEGVELPDPDQSCRDCCGTGVVGKLVDANKEKLICKCVAKQIGKNDGDSEPDEELTPS